MTTWFPVSFACPACGTTMEASEIGSTNVVGRDSDLMPHTAGMHAALLAVAACRCGYADYVGRMRETRLTPAQKHAFLESERPEIADAPPAHRRFELAERTRSILGDGSRALGDLLLHASWCLRLEGVADAALEAGYRSRALAHFSRALADVDMPRENRRATLYLVGELSRLLGRFDDALRAFDPVLADDATDADLRRLAEAVRARAEARDAKLYSVADLMP